MASRRLFIGAAGLGALSAVLPGCAGRGGGSAKPNIVIIAADDMGWNDAGYHNPHISTPRIDAFVKQGVELDRFYVCPVCTPTRAGLLTGRYPHRYGLRNGVIPPWRDAGLDPAEQCLPELLAGAGYARRACFGKWHLGHHHRKHHPLNRGFTHFYGHYNGAIDYFTHKREKERDWHRGYEPNADEGYSTDLITADAVKFINASVPGEPFFMYVPYNAPHGPLQAPADLLAAYEKGENGKYPKRDIFKAMMKSLDNGIGKVLDVIDDNGMRDNTLVIFFSDNGGKYRVGGSNKPLKGEKGGVEEGGVRVPAAVRWPAKLKGGRKLNTVMGYVDILPTVLAAAGVTETPKNDLDGTNLLPLFKGTTDNIDRVFYLGQGAVLEGKWKLIRGALYDISRDPGETTDLAAQHPELVARLQKRLIAFDELRGGTPLPPWAEGKKGFTAPKDWRIPE